MKASLDATASQSAKKKLSIYVADIFNLADIDLVAVLVDFGPSVRHWSPTMHEHVLGQGADAIVMKYPLLALSAWLVTSSPLKGASDPHHSHLYQALKQTFAIQQSTDKTGLEALQVGLSIVVYEVGHGLSSQAFQTLSCCKAILILLAHDELNGSDIQAQQTMDWLRASLLMLDR